MSKYVVKGALREVKNYTKGYSDIQAKVRQATSNDPWGPSGTMMSEIAQATYNHHEFIEIMEMIDKRLNDSGKNWRHVFKALTLLDYCLHSGSDNVVAYARENLYVVKTLREFQFIDEEGKDQGANVRQKAKDITALLSDNERLQQERRTRNAMRDRMVGGGTDSPQRRVGGYSSDGPGMGDEERDLQRAIEESKRTAQEHERKMRASNEDLRAAMQLSEREKRDKDQQDLDSRNNFDLFGAGPSRPQDISFDPFDSVDGQRVNAQQTGGQDLFGLAFGNSSQPQQNFGYGAQQQAQQQGFQSNAFGGAGLSNQLTNQTTNPFGNTFGGVPIQSTGTSSYGTAQSTNFTSDGMAGGSSLARGNAQIDPFASVAGGRGNANNAFGGGSHNNPFGGQDNFDVGGSVMTPTQPGQSAANQSAFPSGLPGGNVNNGLVNLDSLTSSSSLQQSSKNPFAAPGSSSPRKYDWSSGGGPNANKPQRTLAELAVNNPGSNLGSGSLRPAGMMTGLGNSGGFGSSQFGSGSGQQFFGQAQGGLNGQLQQQQGFGSSGAFGGQTAGGNSAFGGQQAQQSGNNTNLLF